MTSTVNTVNLYTIYTLYKKWKCGQQKEHSKERKATIDYCSFIVYRPKRGWIYLLNIIYHYLASQWLAKGCCTTVNHN